MEGFMDLLKNIYKYVFFIVLLLLLPLKQYAQDNWELIRDEKGIKVYLNSDIEGNRTEVKVTMSTNGKALYFYKIMQNVDNYKAWIYHVISAHKVKQITNDRFIYYLVADFPWPAKDRDAVIQLSINNQPNTEVVHVNTHSVEGVVSEKKKYSRFKVIKASWVCKQQNEHEVAITYKAVVDPEISLPDWLFEMVYTLAPYNTMKNLKVLLKEIG